MCSKLEDLITLKKSMEIPVVSNHVPSEIFTEYMKTSDHKYRDRLYGLETVFLGMIFQSLSSDKSEQNTVLFISEYYKNLNEQLSLSLSEQALEIPKPLPKKRGRPVKHRIKIQKSKLGKISLNTASYDEGRHRFPLELAEKIFERINQEVQVEQLWKGHKVLIADGSTFITPDTKELRSYLHPQKEKNPQPLPIMRIEGLINLYGGHIEDFVLDNYQSSEGKMLKMLYRSIPEGTVLLADDLYSSYGHIAYCISKGVEIITQGKHKRKDKILYENGPNDVVVEWKSGIRPSWFSNEDDLPEKLQVRRISYENPKNSNEKINIYTTLMDVEGYKAVDVLALYIMRWDIELGFREIKIILEMKYLRSKTVDMVKKEVYMALILYNILRIKFLEILVKHNIDFFSHGTFIQSNITIRSSEGNYVDKLGRSYARKSPGRLRRVPFTND